MIPLEYVNWNPWMLKQDGAQFQKILTDSPNVSDILISIGPKSKKP